MKSADLSITNNDDQEGFTRVVIRHRWKNNELREIKRVQNQTSWC